ncbi:MAG: YceH family protein [Pseudomonadota bacterium]
MTLKTLTPIEARVLGTLMEKARTVPDSYPLSLNALVSGCNQKTSRDPLMEVGDDEARAAIDTLKSQSLVFEGSSSRVPRFEHNLPRAAGVNEMQSVVIGLLLLRGPQTPAELRTSGERWYKFSDAGAVEAVLQELQQRGDDGGQALVLKLPRAPGAREQRWVHLLCGEPDISALVASAPAASEAGDLLARVTALENSVARLRADNAQLREHIRSISGQLGIALPDLDAEAPVAG